MNVAMPNRIRTETKDLILIDSSWTQRIVAIVVGLFCIIFPTFMLIMLIYSVLPVNSYNVIGIIVALFFGLVGIMVFLSGIFGVSIAVDAKSRYVIKGIGGFVTRKIPFSELYAIDLCKNEYGYTTLGLIGSKRWITSNHNWDMNLILTTSEKINLCAGKNESCANSLAEKISRITDLMITTRTRRIECSGD